MNELKPCPHCGNSVDFYEFTYPNGDKGWRVSSLWGCYVCENIRDIEPEDRDAFVEAWNMREGESE